MNGCRTLRACFIALLCMGLLCASLSPASAVEFSYGNILVSTQGQLREYTPQGVLKNTISVPHPDVAPFSSRSVGGVAVDPSGKVWIANLASGPYSTYLSRFDPISDTWDHFAHPLGDFANNAFNRDLAVFEDRVFFGEYQFDSADSTWTQLPATVFPPGRPAAHVSFGEDQLMYGLISGSPRERVRVSDPSTFEVIGDLELRDGGDRRVHATGLSATHDGTLYIVDSNRVFLYKFASDGTFLDQVNSGITFSLICMDMNAQGMIVAGSNNGQVVVTNTAFDTPTHFDVGSIAYVAIVPEPTAVGLAGAGAIWLAVWRMGRKRRQSESQTSSESESKKG